MSEEKEIEELCTTILEILEDLVLEQATNPLPTFVEIQSLAVKKLKKEVNRGLLFRALTALGTKGLVKSRKKLYYSTAMLEQFRRFLLEKRERTGKNIYKSETKK